MLMMIMNMMLMGKGVLFKSVKANILPTHFISFLNHLLHTHTHVCLITFCRLYCKYSIRQNQHFKRFCKVIKHWKGDTLLLKRLTTQSIYGAKTLFLDIAQTYEHYFLREWTEYLRVHIYIPTTMDKVVLPITKNQKYMLWKYAQGYPTTNLVSKQPFLINCILILKSFWQS